MVLDRWPTSDTLDLDKDAAKAELANTVTRMAFIQHRLMAMRVTVAANSALAPSLSRSSVSPVGHRSRTTGSSAGTRYFRIRASTNAHLFETIEPTLITNRHR
ncbi:MAG: hypothetical protein ACKOYO_04925 [Actinomycetota bacterium]